MDVGFVKGSGGGTAISSRQNLKNNDIHNLLIKIRFTLVSRCSLKTVPFPLVHLITIADARISTRVSKVVCAKQAAILQFSNTGKLVL